MDISVIVTAGNEGIIAHHSMRSLFKAVDYAQKFGITSEVLIILDAANSETEKYFSRYEDSEICKIFRVNFLDVWESKNFGVDNASGKYLTFLQAKDLFSENWLALGFQALESFSEKIIAHPMYEVDFDAAQGIVQSIDNDDLINFALLSGNVFPSVCIASKEIFLIHRFISARNKYFDPEWSFNCSAIKYKRYSVEKTVVFIRRYKKKIPSLEKVRYSQNIKLCPDFNFPIKYTNNSHYHSILKMLSFIRYPRILWYQNYLNSYYFQSPIKKKAPWLLHEIIKINEIEPIIQSKQYRNARPTTYIQENSNFLESSCLKKILEQYDQNTNFYVFMPFIGSGGAGKVASFYIDEIASQKHNHITIFTTDRMKSAVLHLLPSNVNVVHLEHILDNYLTERQKAKIMAALIVRYKPAKIYAYNSNLFFETLSMYGDEIIKRSKIYINIFALSFRKDTREMWWTNTNFAAKIFPYVTNIITDNKRLINDLTKLYGLNEDKFICNHSYINIRDNVPAFRENSFNVFWASRICKEKRLDILLEIARKCKNFPIIFHIFGAGSGDEYLNKLKKLSNVKYYGKFNGFDTIVNPEFDVFLYTSESDGIPNVILEATSHGYPVIAPNIGGISEVITGKTGFLIENYTDVDGYVETLRKLLLDKSILRNRQKYIRKLLISDFNKENFINTMKRIGML
jgi:glycosyltransferase involved in cell wall biosynthesis